MFKLGIDDAGRGPVIGPMVLAGVLIDDKHEKELVRLGVKDSKQLTPKRREFLVDKIKEVAETFEIVVITPNEIDGLEEVNLNRTKLNELEAHAAAKIINTINKGFKEIEVIIDCPSVSLVKWGDYLKRHVDNLSNLNFKVEHKADVNHLAVSAASIIAKSVREKEMDKLREKYGNEIGSGYCHDPNTIKFLEKYSEKYEHDGIFRKTWATWTDLITKKSQMKLDI
ncbi:MAG: ribonuclease HII [Nanoarchaeota archaeon]